MKKKELIMKKTGVISIVSVLGLLVFWVFALVVFFCFKEWLLSWWTSSMSFFGVCILLTSLWMLFCIGWLTYTTRKIQRGPEKVKVVEAEGLC